MLDNLRTTDLVICVTMVSLGDSQSDPVLLFRETTQGLAPVGEATLTMTNFGFLIDNRKCIGCHACTVACKSEHDVPIGVDRTWVKYIEKGEFPNNRRMFSVMRCNHCEYAPCVSICPVTALYRREDGIVDFNNERCIGCKACMQACPYDALFIDPSSNTAAKCNFCTHRLEAGLEPSCVVVCPEQAIVCGDLDDTTSELSQLIERHPVQVRKPEKATKPNLYYIDGDEASLVPTRAAADGRNMWSRNETTPEPLENSMGEPQRAYDVRPRPPAWGWQVVAYTWTKSIAAGGILATAAAQWLAGSDHAQAVAGPLAWTSFVFLLITTALLIADLKRPERFLYVLLRPQWKSWLVRGAYFLVAYGAMLTGWLATRGNVPGLSDFFFWSSAALAIPSAVYTAFLFAQAKGRDLWQNPLLSIHLLIHAFLAGGCAWFFFASQQADLNQDMPRMFLQVCLWASLAIVVGEILTPHATEDARRAMKMIVGKTFGMSFWTVGLVLGHVLPIILLTFQSTPLAIVPVFVLAGMYAIERVWVLAPQRIPLS